MESQRETNTAAGIREALVTAAERFADRAEIALMKASRVGDPPLAKQIVLYVPGTNAQSFAPVSAFVRQVSGTHLASTLGSVGSHAFRAYLQQLIAARVIGETQGEIATTERRIHDGLLDLFVDDAHPRTVPDTVPEQGKTANDLRSLQRRSFTSEFRPHFETLWSGLASLCTDIARQVLAFPVPDDRPLSWVDATLAPAMIQSVERLTRALQDRPEQGRDAVWIGEYLRNFHRTHHTIALPDLGTRREVPYGDLFVEPSLSSEFGRGLSMSDVESCLDRTVILGDPGAGKSTLSRRLALNRVQAGKLVFLLPVRALRIEPEGFLLVQEIERLLATRYQAPPPPGLVDRILLEGSALLVFDGIDEVESLALRKTASECIEAVSDVYPLARILVTARRIGYQAVQLDRSVFVEHSVQPFDGGQVEDYADKWFSLATARLSRVEVREMVENFMHTSRDIHDLRQNPLMLSFICVLFRGYNDIPRRRAQIYRKCVELLLRDWDMARGVRPGNWEVDLYEVVLIEIGHLIFTRGEYRDGMTEQQLREISAENLLSAVVADTREAERLAREVIELCRGRGWLFTDVGLDEHGEEIFSFTHPSLMEYFAAQHLLRTSDSLDDLADALLPQILSSRGEVFTQTCINLAASRTAAGGSSLLLLLLDRARARSARETATFLEFAFAAADSIALHREALRALFADFVVSLDRADTSALRRAIFHPHFRQAAVVDAVLAEVLAEQITLDRARVLRLCARYDWFWEFCLQSGLLGLDELHRALVDPRDASGALGRTLERLFGGDLSAASRRPPFTSALWMIETAFPAEQGSSPDLRRRAVRGLADLHAIVGNPFDLAEVLIDPPIRAHLLENVAAVVENLERSLPRASAYRPEIVGATMFLTLALCEIMIAKMSSVGLPHRGVLGRLVDARVSGRQAPNINTGRLADADRDFVRAWQRNDTSIFLWETDYSEFGVS